MVYIYIYNGILCTFLYIHICIMEYYSAIKKNEILTFAGTWMDKEIVILSEVSQRKRSIIWGPLVLNVK